MDSPTFLCTQVYIPSPIFSQRLLTKKTKRGLYSEIEVLLELFPIKTETLNCKDSLGQTILSILSSSARQVEIKNLAKLIVRLVESGAKMGTYIRDYVNRAALSNKKFNYDTSLLNHFSDLPTQQEFSNPDIVECILCHFHALLFVKSFKITLCQIV